MGYSRLDAAAVFIVLVNTMIGVGILTLPREAVEAGGTGAPLAVVLGALPTYLGVTAMVALRPYAASGVRALLEAAVGRLLARLALLAFALVYLGVSATVARAFGEVMVTNVYRLTPLEIFVLTMVATACYLNRHEVDTFVRTQKMLFPVVTVVLALLAISSLRKADPVNLRPVLGHDLAALASAASTAAFSYAGPGVLFFLLPLVGRGRLRGVPVAALGLTAAVYGLVVTSALGVFGAFELQSITWPTIELLKITEIPGRVLERLESAFLAVWVAAVFTTLSATLFTAVRALQELFGLPSPAPLATAVLPWVYMYALTPAHFAQLGTMMRWLGVIALGMEVGLPLALLLAVRLRRVQPCAAPPAS